MAIAHGQTYLTQGAKLDFAGIATGRGGRVDYKVGSASWENGQTLGFMSWALLDVGNPNHATVLNGLGGATNADGFAGGSYQTGENIDLYSVCSELLPLSDPQYVDVLYSNDPFLGNARARAGTVVSTMFGSVTAFEDAWGGSANADRAVGFQIAVWAARYGGGAMTITGTGNSSVINVASYLGSAGFYARYDSVGNWANIKFYAQQYYDAARTTWLAGGTSQAIYLLGANSGTKSDQDQITIDNRLPPQSVPEPFTMGLMAAGAAAYVRKRAAKKRAVAAA